MSRFVDLTGLQFSKWYVVKYAFSKSGRTYYLCKCECGTEKYIEAYNLKSGKSKSCGCLKKEFPNHSKHELSSSKLYKTWADMKTRCYNTNYYQFDIYGGRGIIVCDEWKNDFLAFYNWSMENGYEDNLTIDRIDNNKGYSPDNCRWVTYKIQNNNKRNTIRLTYNNETHSISEWSEITHLTHLQIYKRIKRGWSVQKILNTPALKNKYK